MLQIIGAKVDNVILVESAHDPLLRARVDLSSTLVPNSLDTVEVNYNRLYVDYNKYAKDNNLEGTEPNHDILWKKGNKELFEIINSNSNIT